MYTLPAVRCSRLCWLGYICNWHESVPRVCRRVYACKIMCRHVVVVVSGVFMCACLRVSACVCGVCMRRCVSGSVCHICVRVWQCGSCLCASTGRACIHSSLVPTRAFVNIKPCVTNHSIFIYPYPLFTKFTVLKSPIIS